MDQNGAYYGTYDNWNSYPVENDPRCLERPGYNSGDNYRSDGVLQQGQASSYDPIYDGNREVPPMDYYLPDQVNGGYESRNTLLGGDVGNAGERFQQDQTATYNNSQTYNT